MTSNHHHTLRQRGKLVRQHVLFKPMGVVLQRYVNVDGNRRSFSLFSSILTIERMTRRRDLVDSALIIYEEILRTEVVPHRSSAFLQRLQQSASKRTSTSWSMKKNGRTNSTHSTHSTHGKTKKKQDSPTKTCKQQKVKKRQSSRKHSDDEDWTPESSTEQRLLSKKSKQIMRKWFNAHIDHPFPTRDEKWELSKRAHISYEQVSWWFKNQRKRHWKQKDKNEATTPCTKTVRATA